MSCNQTESAFEGGPPSSCSPNDSDRSYWLELLQMFKLHFWTLWLSSITNTSKLSFDSSQPPQPAATTLPVCKLAGVIGVLLILGFLWKVKERFWLTENSRGVIRWNENSRVNDTIIGHLSFVTMTKSLLPITLLKDLLNTAQVSIWRGSQSVQIIQEIDEAENEIVFRFSVKKAGEYEIRVFHNFFWFPKQFQLGGKLVKEILSGDVDPLKTTFSGQRTGKIVCLKTGDSFFMHIEPKDRYSNICLVDEVDMQLFSFDYTPLDEAESETNFQEIDFENSVEYEFDVHGNQRIYLMLNISRPGMWRGMISYKDVAIRGGAIDIVCITSAEDHDLTQKLMGSPVLLRLPEFEAEVATIDPGFLRRHFTIWIGLSPKYIFLHNAENQHRLKQRFATFRICSRTKIAFLSTYQGNNYYILELHDDMHDPINFVIQASCGRILLVMFSHFQTMQKSNAVNMPFEKKRKIFFEDLRVSKQYERSPHKTVVVQRNNILPTTFREVIHYHPEDWMRAFIISFHGENPVAAGGLEQWLQLLFKTLFKNDDGGLFCTYGNSSLLHPNTVQYRSDIWTLQHYRLAGLLLGKYLFECAVNNFQGKVLECSFTHSFLSQIVGLLPNYKQVETDHPDMFEKRFRPILDSNNIESRYLNYTEEFDIRGNLITPQDLIANGASVFVTDGDKDRYLNHLARYYMSTGVWEEIENFRIGFYYIIQEDLLSNFDVQDLHLLLTYGKSEWFNSNFIFNDTRSDANVSVSQSQTGPWQRRSPAVSSRVQSQQPFIGQQQQYGPVISYNASSLGMQSSRRRLQSRGRLAAARTPRSMGSPMDIND